MRTLRSLKLKETRRKVAEKCAHARFAVVWLLPERWLVVRIDPGAAAEGEASYSSRASLNLAIARFPESESTMGMIGLRGSWHVRREARSAPGDPTEASAARA
jgi:hypothetical protein